MADLITLQSAYELGMRQDPPRHQLPRGSSWNVLDFLPAHEAPLVKRGGWAYDGSYPGGAGYTAAIAFAPWASGSERIAVRSNGDVFDHAGNNIGSVTGLPVAPLIFHRDRLMIPRKNQTLRASLGGAALADIAAAPKAAYGAVFKDYTVLGNGYVGATEYANRTWFSAPGDPTTWDTANSWVNLSFPITGIAALRNSILFFSLGRTERLRGTTPPASGDLGDFVREPLFDVGCLDARSVVVLGDSAIWASGEGVWMTDGAAIEDLTESGGLGRYWTALLKTYDAATWTLAAGILQNHYIITVMDGATFKDCLICDLDTKSWHRASNIQAIMFAAAIGTSEELYVADRGEARVGKLSPIFDPLTAGASDGDGAVVLPVWESAFYRDEAALKTWRELFLGAHITDPATNNPYLEVSIMRALTDSAYTVLGRTFVETTEYTRLPFDLNFDSEGLALKVRQLAGSGTTRIWDLQARVTALESHRIR